MTSDRKPHKRRKEKRLAEITFSRAFPSRCCCCCFRPGGSSISQNMPWSSSSTNNRAIKDLHSKETTFNMTSLDILVLSGIWWQVSFGLLWPVKIVASERLISLKTALRLVNRRRRAKGRHKICTNLLMLLQCMQCEKRSFCLPRLVLSLCAHEGSLGTSKILAARHLFVQWPARIFHF